MEGFGTANGAFAILHSGSNDDATVGAVELEKYDAQGLHTHVFENGNSSLRSLSLRFLNRLGEPAHFGRIHLWLKVCASSG